MADGVTLGGDRLGSGNHQKQYLHDYERSNHNLSCSRVTSMAPGVLYPIYVNMGLTADTFDIDLNAFMRTLPTEGPMFGAFKLQLDVFTADDRLYQAILHNNTTEIGMDMNQVYLPKIEITTNVKRISSASQQLKEQISRNALLNYLGISGIGGVVGASIPSDGVTVKRKFNAIPILAYYDIFKNYYSNKQEKDAYVIANGDYVDTIVATSSVTKIEVYNSIDGWVEVANSGEITIAPNSEDPTSGEYYSIRLYGENLFVNNQFNFEFNVGNPNNNGLWMPTLGDPNDSRMWMPIHKQNTFVELEYMGSAESLHLPVVTKQTSETVVVKSNAINLKPFELKNIDTMRKQLLQLWDLGEEYVIDDTEEMLPYKALVEVNDLAGDEHRYENMSYSPMQGLVVKCYQSDMFNNWLQTEWVNTITNKSKVSVQNGSFTMDALNMAKKIYNLYNRIAISGGTYDDWQLAAYGQDVYGKTEKPVYHGGMSAEVTFDEVVSTTASIQGEELQPLGTLGGRGNLSRGKGGHVIIKCREHCCIMIMASLTPRLTYSQGNAWYMNLDSVDDFHKPEFDQIGFQDMIGEYMAWWDTKITQGTNAINQTSYGKQPAWIHYQTDVDKVYGDFAELDGKGFMVLQRQYEIDENTGHIKDMTAYIDPSKYNYPFAVNDITAQNFWGFFDFEITARRLMSAKQIPNV